MATRRRKTRTNKKAAKRPAAKKKVGKKGMTPFVPTAEMREQVKALVGYGLKYDQIAILVKNPRTGKGISTRTLQDHFQRELQEGLAIANSTVAQSLYTKATSTFHPQAATCAIWWTKARMGWRGETKHVHAVEGATGVLVAPAAMAVDDWIAEQEKKNEDKEAPE